MLTLSGLMQAEALFLYETVNMNVFRGQQKATMSPSRGQSWYCNALEPSLTGTVSHWTGTRAALDTKLICTIHNHLLLRRFDKGNRELGDRKQTGWLPPVIVAFLALLFLRFITHPK